MVEIVKKNRVSANKNIKASKSSSSLSSSSIMAQRPKTDLHVALLEFAGSKALRTMILGCDSRRVLCEKIFKVSAHFTFLFS